MKSKDPQSKKQPNFDIVDFLDRWGKIAGLVATIVSAILFALQSFIQSVVLVLVGWLLISSWLLGIGRKNSTNHHIKYRTYISIAILTILVGVWVSYGIQEEIKKYRFPEGSTLMPGAEYAGISIFVDSWSSADGSKIIHHSIDRTSKVQQIDPAWLGEPADHVGNIANLRLFITGQALEGQTQVQNRVPIKLVSYSPVDTGIDILSPPEGGQGGNNAWLYFLDFPDKSLLEPGQILSAKPDVNIDKQILLEAFTPDDFEFLPSEVQRAISNPDQADFPDVFSLNKDEQVLFSIALVFNTPGIYEIEPGIEYIYQGKKGIAWAKPSIKFIVLDSYYKWQQLGIAEDKIIARLAGFCQFSKGYQCD